MRNRYTSYVPAGGDGGGEAGGAGAVAAAGTRLGGQPHWLGAAQWPVNPYDGEPADFVGQFRTAGDGLVHLFALGFSGEFVTVVQPGGQVSGDVEVRAAETGPTVLERVHEIRPRADADPAKPCFDQLGGPDVEPVWLQSDDGPEDGWQLLAQFDSCTLPFEVNFGDTGVGYLFGSTDGAEARFFFQCC